MGDRCLYKKIELIGQMPLGWESNYDLVQKELDKKKRLTMHVEVEPHHFCNLPASPFKDYLAAFKAFHRLKTIERDLLQILMMLTSCLLLVDTCCWAKQSKWLIQCSHLQMARMIEFRQSYPN